MKKKKAGRGSRTWTHGGFDSLTFHRKQSVGKVLDDAALTFSGGSERREPDSREERLVAVSVDHKVNA